MSKATERRAALRQRIKGLNKEHPLRASGQETIKVDEVFHSYSHYAVDYAHTTLSTEDLPAESGNQLQDQERTIDQDNGW